MKHVTGIRSLMVPAIRSAAAKFTINQLNGALRFLFGSNATARIMRIFPRIFKKDRIREMPVVRTDSASGASENGQFYSN